MHCAILTLDVDVDGQRLAGAHDVLGLTCVSARVTARYWSELQGLLQADDVTSSRTLPDDLGCWVRIGHAH
jgi:hypothetical protein